MNILEHKNMKNLIIFTDLDGTLLDSNYSFKDATSALKLIKERDIPLIICTSKTRAEIGQYRKRLKNTHPFISENGGGIFIPKEYFRFQVSGLRFQVEENEKYHIIRLGARYSNLRKALEELRLEGFDIKGFGDMSIKEIAELTGLRISEARLAKEREFDEPFIFRGNKGRLEELKQSIESKGFNFTQGEFFHIMGRSDKGRAVEIVKGLYKRDKGSIVTIALGDSLNDIEMLEKVDYPVIVKKANGRYDRRVKVKRLVKAGDIGPKGWNKAVKDLLETLFL
jgi:mannosyl-3-phosphoglycerate phosphatase